MMPVQYAGNCPVHICVDSLEYKRLIEISLKRSNASKTIKRRWKGKIGAERVFQ